MSYDLFAICGVAIAGILIVLWQLEQYDSRPAGGDDLPEVDPRPDQRFRQFEGG